MGIGRWWEALGDFSHVVKVRGEEEGGRREERGMFC